MPSKVAAVRGEGFDLLCESIPSRWRDPQGLIAARVDFLDEATGVEAHDLVALVVEHGIAQIELFHRTRDGDVEEAALFFEVSLINCSFERKGAVGQPDHKDDGEL